MPVPELIEPSEPAAGHELQSLVKIAMALPSVERALIQEKADNLPELLRVRPADPLQTYSSRDSSAGSMLVTLLCANRNLYSPVPPPRPWRS